MRLRFSYCFVTHKSRDCKPQGYIFTQLRIRVYDQKGSIEPAAMCQELGFRAGGRMMRKKDKLVVRVLQWRNDQVEIEVDADQDEQEGVYRIECSSLLEGDWKPLKDEQASYVAIERYEHLMIQGREEMSAAVVKGKVLQCLLDLEKKYAKPMNDLRIIFKPRKEVRAKGAYPKGKLILVPSTWKLDFKEPASGIKIDCGQDAWLISACVGPQGDDFSKAVVNPFWHVGKSHDPNECNMELYVPKDNNPFKIPLMRNLCPISENDQLVRFEEKREKKMAPLVPVQKKRRTT